MASDRKGRGGAREPELPNVFEGLGEPAATEESGSEASSASDGDDAEPASSESGPDRPEDGAPDAHAPAVVEGAAISRRGSRRTAIAPLIPGYRIESIIGRGATGVVYRARQLAVDREVALKVLHPELAGKQRTIRRLQREARTTARLAHPHIVSAIDMGEVAGRWWYAMELVDGPSLALRLRQEGRLAEREALRLFIPLCEALVHMSEHGVVHRDIKPGNILIDRAGGARLADLGLAFADDDPLLTTSDGTLGTPHYISPEQARDPAAADVRSDIWSFGGTLFHALCGRPPFAGESTAEVLSGVLYASIPDPQRLEPELSRGLSLILRKCLSRSPLRRYQAPAELLADLERVRERRRPKVSITSLDPVQGRLPHWVPWAIGVAALVLAGSGAWLWHTKPWEIAADPGPSAWLVGLRVRLARSPSELASVLSLLESGPGGASDFERAELRNEATQQLWRELESLMDETEPRVAELLARGDHVEVARALGSGLESALLARTGFDFERLGDRGALLFVWLDVQRKATEEALADAIARLDSAVAEHVSTELLPLIDRLQREKEWTLAREELARTPENVIADADARVDGLPRAEVERVARWIEQQLAARGAALERDWLVLDAELQGWVVQYAAELEAALRARTLLWGASDTLAGRWASKLSEEGFPRALYPRSLSTDAEDRLWQQVERLNEIEAGIRAAEAEKGFDVLDAVIAWLDAAEAGELYASRDYATAAQRWQVYASRIEDLALPDESGPWRARLTSLVDARVQEGRMLAALLDRAAQTVRDLDGQEAIVRQGKIGMSGTLIAGDDPRHADFFLQVSASGAPRVLNLRSMDPVGVEGLAGLAVAPPDIEEPSDRLLSALFQYRCGEIDRSLAALDSGPLPDDPIGLLLADDLRRRIGRSAEVAAARRLERESSAAIRRGQLSIKLVSEEDLGGALKIIEELLDSYSDTEVVQRDRKELLRWRDYIENPPKRGSEADVSFAYDPDSYEPLSDGRVRLAWELSAGAGERWNVGTDWRVNAGLELYRPAFRIHDLDTQQSSRNAVVLALRTPIDPDQELVLTIDLEVHDDEPKLFVTSIAGFHLALCGAEVFMSRKDPAWQVSRIGLKDLIDKVDGSDVREPAESPLLSRNAAFRLQIRVHRQRGEIEVHLARSGEEPELVCETTIAPWRPGQEAGGSIDVRSWERVTLTRIELVGRVAP